MSTPIRDFACHKSDGKLLQQAALDNKLGNHFLSGQRAVAYPDLVLLALGRFFFLSVISFYFFTQNRRGEEAPGPLP